MNSKQPRLAAISDRARLARLTRGELERLLVRARRAFEAFGTSAGRSEDNDSDDETRYGKKLPPRSAPATV
jgi:Zn-finger nucleic acid-binding protein